MKVGDVLWTWFDAMGAPCRPRQLFVDRTSWGALALYSGQELALMPERAKGRTAPTEAEAVEGWRAAVVEYVKARRLDDQRLIQEAFDGHPGALEWAESVTDTITRLEAERDELRARVAELEAAQRWTPVTEQLPPLGEPVLVLCDGSEDGPLVMSLRASGVMCSGYHWEGPSPWYGSVFSHRDHWRPLPDGPDVAL